VTDVAAASVTVRAGVLTVTVGGGGGDDAFDDDRIDKIRAAATPAATSTTTIRVTRTTCARRRLAGGSIAGSGTGGGDLGARCPVEGDAGKVIGEGSALLAPSAATSFGTSPGVVVESDSPHPPQKRESCVS